MKIVILTFLNGTANSLNGYNLIDEGETLGQYGRYSRQSDNLQPLRRKY